MMSVCVVLLWLAECCLCVCYVFVVCVCVLFALFVLSFCVDVLVIKVVWLVDCVLPCCPTCLQDGSLFCFG